MGTFARSSRRRTSRSISTRSLSASTSTEREATRATTPTTRAGYEECIYIFRAPQLERYVTRTSGILRSESLSEGWSIFCGPPLFHSESHARWHEWPQNIYRLLIQFNSCRSFAGAQMSWIPGLGAAVGPVLCLTLVLIWDSSVSYPPIHTRFCGARNGHELRNPF